MRFKRVEAVLVYGAFFLAVAAGSGHPGKAGTGIAIGTYDVERAYDAAKARDNGYSCTDSYCS